MEEHKARYVLFVVTSALTQSRRGRAFRWDENPSPGWCTSAGSAQLSLLSAPEPFLMVKHAHFFPGGKLSVAMVNNETGGHDDSHTQ
jgi:hypothetical protein